MPNSATASTKPDVARVTRTPWAEAAGTSTVLTSTAQRRKAEVRRRGEGGRRARAPAIGDDGVAAGGGLGQLGVLQVAVRGVADDLGVLLQRGQGAVSEVAGEGLGSVGKEDLHRANSA